MSLIWHSLSGRLLFLTLVFVMIAEILIFVPSSARFRHDFLYERLEKGRIAALAATEARNGMPSAPLQAQVLAEAELYSVVLTNDGRRRPILSRPMTGPVAQTYNLNDMSIWTRIVDAMRAFFRTEPRYIRVVGAPAAGLMDSVEVVLHERILLTAMYDYGERIFVLSLIISVFTASLVYVSVNLFLLRPIRRIIDGIIRFREDPEDASRVYKPSGAGGEIGLAERELAQTQTEVLGALKQKSRLAALGEAVAKINHDLRNMLASSQLLADRLETSKDPLVRRVGPKLIASLDRAIQLCQQTLAYGKAEEQPPALEPTPVARLAEEVRAALGFEGDDGRASAERPSSARPAPGEPSLAGAGAPQPAASPSAPIRFESRAPADLVAVCDPQQMFRALHNLCRNAQQALEASGEGGALAIEARAADGRIEIDVVDDGPGLPDRAREHLFKAFKGSVSRGGSGLGLAIAAELARAHGGALSLVASDASGTRFRISLPDRRAEFGAAPAATRMAAQSLRPEDAA
ncbi:MAG: HAMP domain-containing sensor histidine kinase [Pseudomonadota bacterium]